MKMIMLLMMAVDGASSSTPDVQLLDFSASYCGPCQQMVPILQSMEKEGYPVRQIDISSDPELTKRFNVERIPTLVLLVEGKEVKRFVGLTSGDELRQAMNKAAAALGEKRAGQSALSQPQFAKTAAKDVPAVATVAKESSQPSRRAEPAKVNEKQSLGDMFRRMIGKDDNSGGSPTLRGQDPAANGDLPLDASAASLASTVRIRVAGKSTEDGKYLQDVGTGTIVHSVTGQAIVLTCAHLFLNIAVKEAVVEIEVFEDGKPVTYPAKLVGGDHDADLALLRIRTTKVFPASSISAQIPEPKVGQQLMSFGCNDGDDPTRLDTKLVDINRYDGPPNFVCSVDPISGRSGGGLFSVDGSLMGVCSCADRKTHEGLYAAHGAILDLVKYCELSDILKSAAAAGSSVTPASLGEDSAESFKELMAGPTANPTATAPSVPAAPVPPVVAKVPPSSASPSDFFDTESTPDVTPDDLLELPKSAPGVAGSRGRVFAPPAVSTTSVTAGPEVTILIDDKTGAGPRRIVIPQASAWMLEMLTGEPSETEASVTSTLRPIRTNSVKSR
jgi:thiol-disulfide isomerase/thioredoxin